MFGWVIGYIRAVWDTIVSRDAVPQLAWGFALGTYLGLIPKDNLLAILLSVVILAVRVNLPVTVVTSFVFTWIGVGLDGLAEPIGRGVLEFGLLQGLWSQLLEIPLFAWTSLNNSVVMGHSLIGASCLYPMYRLARFLFGQHADWRANRHPRALTHAAEGAVVDAAESASEAARRSRVRVREAIRWSYIRSRAMRVAAALLLLTFALDPSLRWLLVVAGQRVAQARVDVQRVVSSWTQTRLSVDELAVANPASPDKNLFRADKVALQIDRAQLLRRRYHITHGQIRGLEFAPSRSTSGALVEGELNPATAWALETGKDILSAALKGLEQDVTSELQSPPLARELKQRWPREYARLATEVQDLQQRVERVKQAWENPGETPEEITRSIAQITQDTGLLHGQVQQLRARAGQYWQQLQRDRVAVMRAQQHDRELIGRKVRLVTEFDPAEITQEVLGKQIGGRLVQVARMVQWSRQNIPSADDIADPERSRGEWFYYGKRPPDFYIGKLLVDGQGTVDQQPFGFHAMLSEVSSEPVKPAVMVAKLTGAVSGTMRMNLHLEEAVPRYDIVLDCPHIDMPATELGTSGLGLSFNAAPANAQLKLRIVGGEIRGALNFVQPKLAMTTTIEKLAANRRVAQFVGETPPITDSLPQVRSQLQFEGSLLAPKFSLTSNLGGEVASRLRSNLGGLYDRQRQMLIARANQAVADQLSQLDEALLEYRGPIDRVLGEQTAQLDRLKQRFARRIQLPGNLLDGVPRLFNR